MNITITSKQDSLLFRGELSQDQWVTINDLLNEMVEENEERAVRTSDGRKVKVEIDS